VIVIDALMPPEMATKAEQVGFRKAHLDSISIFDCPLSILD